MEKEELVFNTNDALHKYFYVVKDGAVGLYRNNHLVDHCDEGDVFGIRAILRNDAYQLKAAAIEESIVYALPADQFLDMVQNNLEVHKYLATAFASNLAITNEEKDTAEVSNIDILPLQRVQYSTPVVTCKTEDTIAEAAKLMTVHKIGSILITDSHQQPLGIITDKDLRSKIATGFSILMKPLHKS